MSFIFNQTSIRYSELTLSRLPVEWNFDVALCFCCLLIADLISLAALGIVVVTALAFCGVADVQAEVKTFTCLSVCLLGCLAVQGRYTDRLPFWSELRIVLLGSWCSALVISAWSLATAQHSTFAASIASFALFPGIATAANFFAKSRLARSDVWTCGILLIGAEAALDGVEAAIQSAPSLGYRVVHRIKPALVAAAPAGARLRPLMQRYGARRAIVAVPAEHALHSAMVEAAQTEQVVFGVLPGCGPAPDAENFLSHDVMLMGLRSSAARSPGRLFKIGFDVVAATLVLAFVAPLFAIIAVLNRLDGGPVFFAHRRVGLGARPFYCIKFRTMVVDGSRVLEETLARDPDLAREWEETRKLQHDPRVTRIGRFLRKTSLDELPQLINVLRLEMSLVGPRPIVEDETCRFGDSIVHYYSARPGLTGLWQVSGRSDTSFSRRVKLDVWYVTNWSIWKDIAVLLRTIPAVLARHGAY